MATLYNLRTSITQMGDEEAFKLIRETRFLRRQVPPKKVSKKSTVIKKPISKKAIVASLTNEQKLKLLAELEGDLL